VDGEVRGFTIEETSSFGVKDDKLVIGDNGIKFMYALYKFEPASLTPDEYRVTFTFQAGPGALEDDGITIDGMEIVIAFGMPDNLMGILQEPVVESPGRESFDGALTLALDIAGSEGTVDLELELGTISSVSEIDNPEINGDTEIRGLDSAAFAGSFEVEMVYKNGLAALNVSSLAEGQDDVLISMATSFPFAPLGDSVYLAAFSRRPQGSDGPTDFLRIDNFCVGGCE